MAPNNPFIFKELNQYAIPNRHMTKITNIYDLDSMICIILFDESSKLKKNPIINNILIIGIEKLSDPLQLVISAAVAAVAINNAKNNKKIFGWLKNHFENI
tara:strand:+ start:216 stop:518 length:303 start_codon:yes stop_codon:yes gene_type:complete